MSARIKYSPGLLAGALLLAGTSLSAADTGSVTSPEFGAVSITEPAGARKGFALLAGRAEAGRPGPAAVVGELAGAGYVVAAFDAEAWAERAGRRGGPCAYPAGDLETLAHDLERRAGFTDYATPLLVGTGPGAALAYAALAEAPAGTFAGAISLHFCPELPMAKPLCPGRGLKTRGPGGAVIAFLPGGTTRLADPWAVLPAGGPAACASDAAAFVGATPEARRVAPGSSADGGSGAADIRAALKTLTADGTPAPARPAGSTSSPVADLPLTEIPAAAGPVGDTVAVFLSGDGGWREFDRAVSRELSGRGIPVVGWDSLKYFWSARTPAGSAADLDRVIAYYTSAWHRPRVLLVGYSFGADALPLILPAARARQPVALVALLAPGAEGSLEFHVSDWIGGGRHADSVRLAPAIRALAPLPVLCLYGSDDRGSACRGLGAPGVRTLALPGDHHFNGDTARVAREILATLPAESGRGIPPK